MKKILGLIAVLIFSLSFTQAQQTNFGIKGGYNSASIEVDNGTDYDAKSGLHVGGLAHIHVSSRFAVQPELVYSCQGWRASQFQIEIRIYQSPCPGSILWLVVASGCKRVLSLGSWFLRSKRSVILNRCR